MKSLHLISILMLLFSQSITSQNTLLPLNIQKAYNNGTRSMDGKPGLSYWQNSSDYNIDVRVDTENDKVIGSASIIYTNNSPDTLKSIVLRLYQDFFREGNARQWAINRGDLMEGTRITKLTIDGISYDKQKDFPGYYMTNFRLKLKDKILPGSKTKIELEWDFELPTVRGLRMRKYDDGHYFIAYWYPQIAVYDDIDGWDMIEYTGLVEFYNDINNYNVNITVPNDYMVWATGDPQNLEDILQKGIFDRYRKTLKSDEVVKIITQQDYSDNKVFKKSRENTWNFKADNVPDFSFACSNKSNWDGSSLEVDKSTGRRVLVDVVYPEGSEHWAKGALVSRAAVKYLSFELPGVPFPYPHMTSFWSGTRGGGMESPMMANNGAPENYGSFIELLFHEISHTYFPFYMGTNERKYAWMDEGWAAYLPSEVAETLYPEGDYLKERVELYSGPAGEEVELPLMAPSFQHNSYTSARQAAYNKPAMAYHLLRDALGDKMFKKALHAYIERWNGKHPLPYDFFNTFNEINGESLDWFWNPWFYENGYPDLGIKEVTENNKVVVEKIGTHPVPVSIFYYTVDGRSGKVYKNTSVWKNGDSEITIDLPENANIIKIELGNDYIPDVVPSNNVWSK